MARTMQFTGEHSTSFGWKSVIVAGFAVALLASAWVMFAGAETFAVEGHLGRQAILMACSVVYAVRVSITLFVFLRRKLAWWEGLLGAMGLPALVFMFAWVGGDQDRPLGPIDALGVILYLLGSYLGTRSELSRHIWRAKPANKGHLYTQGLFRYARHINYLGDVVLFSGFALITRDPWMLIVPLAMTVSFVLMVIPAHDAYLANRYGDEFWKYAQQTKRLIPLVY